MPIRSYRRVFEVDRRIYRVDDWTLPVPGGVPLRAIAYFAGTLLAVLIARQLPLLGALLGVLNPPLRYVVLPLLIAALGSQIAPDGRAAHSFARDWVRFAVRRRRRSAGRPLPLCEEPIAWHAVLPFKRTPPEAPHDGRAVVWRRARVHGPAEVFFAAPADVEHRRRGRIIARPHCESSRRRRGVAVDWVQVPPGSTLEVRP